MRIYALLVALFAAPFSLLTSPQPQQQHQQKKYPWQEEDTNCDKTFTFCWYGAEVTAYGNRWVAQDKDEKPFEWITEVRCLKESKLCILARNQKAFNGSHTNIDLYRIAEWDSVQIRAIEESDFAPGKECEIDTLLLNRAERSVTMLSTPGPAAATQRCMGIMKPKTVVYKLEVGPPKL
jgi:hypothetical protein